jgi:hypothetical protein
MAYTEKKTVACNGDEGMGSAFYRIKIGMYVFVIFMVGILFAVRVYNAWQRTNYYTEVIFENGEVQISLHYPAEILSPRNETSYPLTLSFNYIGDVPSSQSYEISLKSPTLIFVDANGAEFTPRFQFTSDQTFLEQSVYVHPYLSEVYPQHHLIIVQLVADDPKKITQSNEIKIRTEPEWRSFYGLYAIELTIILGVVSLITKIISDINVFAQERVKSRKERVAKILGTLSSLSSSSYLEQMDKVRQLEDEIQNEKLNDDVGEEIKRVKNRFTEEEFFRAMGEQLRKDRPIDFSKVQNLHNLFNPPSENKDCMKALGRILASNAFPAEEIFTLITAIMKLWDSLDADAKDLIIEALKRLSQKAVLSSISATELQTQVFTTSKRRRLLRDVEIQRIFPQLVDPLKGKPLPLGYDAKWRHFHKSSDDPKIVDWLGNFSLVSNPFGVGNLKNCPFYPEGSARPDRWEDVLAPFPQRVQCLTPEDAKALNFLMRSECFPKKKVDPQGNETLDPGKQTFPVMVSFEQSAPSETPLITLARSTAQTWMEILSFSPDGMLDLLPAEQVALLELLCWNFGSNSMVINLLKQAGQKNNPTDRLLIRKIDEFKTEFSSSHLPQDAVLLSWLKVRPPDLNHTYLIIPIDEFPENVRSWWLEQFIPLIPAFFLNGIVIKLFSSSYIPVTIPLSAIRISWSEAQLKMSLNAQFDAAVDKTRRNEMGLRLNFRSLFGFNASVGYFEAEEDTTDKLISASHNSLARMLTLGNRLFQYHCENRIKDGVPEKYLYIEDLKTILKIT